MVQLTKNSEKITTKELSKIGSRSCVKKAFLSTFTNCLCDSLNHFAAMEKMFIIIKQSSFQKMLI
jgi:uncharacterized FlgJ-related protein